MSRSLYIMGKLTRILSTGPYARAFLFHGSAATVEHVAALAPLACQTVIDVGANRGQFALVARRCFPQAHVVSFEPVPGALDHLQRITRDDPLTTVHQAALGDKSGEMTIHVASHDHSSSLLPMTAHQTRLFPGTVERSQLTVRVGRLSEFIDVESIIAPAILKLDVQGYELSVLKGCEDLLDRFSYVYAECSFIELYEGQAMAGEVIAWLHERGFRLRGVHNTLFERRDKSAVQADFLFVNGSTTT